MPPLPALSKKISRRTLVIAGAVVLCGVYWYAAMTSAQTKAPVDTYNQQIEERKSDIEKIQKRIELYQQRIQTMQKDAGTLRGQLGLLENEIAKKQLDIELTAKQIAQTILEIQQTGKEIATQEKKIAAQRQRIRQLLKLIDREDQVSALEVLVNNQTFSDFYDQYQRLQDVQTQVQRAHVKLRHLQAGLQLQQSSLMAKQKNEEQLKDAFTQQKQDLSEQSVEQATLLQSTERSEKKYASYVLELKLEQQQINQDIVGIEKKIREELRRQQAAERFAKFGKLNLEWPTAGRYITASFHDPEYPYRNIFEHPAIDIRTPQGSPVYAAESGYVAKIKDGGARGYSYLMLLHNENKSTVYGHVSRFDVKEGQFVTQGQLIARSGGTPGTAGAGRLTTGPHLHFEVRDNGIPVNPINYLPQE